MPCFATSSKMPGAIREAMLSASISTASRCCLPGHSSALSPSLLTRERKCLHPNGAGSPEVWRGEMGARDALRTNARKAKKGSEKQEEEKESAKKKQVACADAPSTQ